MGRAETQTVMVSFHHMSCIHPCPPFVSSAALQRERRGWLGDAQLSFETVIHNIDGGAFYKKWIQDLVDTQVYDNATMNAEMALPDCVPFYGHGHTESDPGWGIAGWLVPDKFATFYADDGKCKGLRLSQQVITDR